MQVHRAVPHHTGYPPGSMDHLDLPYDMTAQPTAEGLAGPADIMERGINGQIHHTRTQGPWGVRGETAIPMGRDGSGYRRNLEDVYEHDSAFKSTVLHSIGRDALELQMKLQRSGKVTPQHLLKPVELPWSELRPTVGKRSEVPWAKVVRDHLVRDQARPTWWSLPRGARVPLLHLGANEIPLLAAHGVGQPVTQGLEAIHPVKTLRETVRKLGRNRAEVQAVGHSLWVTYRELAETDRPNRAAHLKSARTVASLIGKSTAAMVKSTLDLAGRLDPSVVADARNALR
jgi:hypothetical protein